MKRHFAVHIPIASALTSMLMVLAPMIANATTADAGQPHTTAAHTVQATAAASAASSQAEVQAPQVPAALMTAAVAKVKNAAAQGPQALSKLVAQLEDSTPVKTSSGAPATTPAEYALGMALEPYASGSFTATDDASLQPDTANAAVANASRCWFVGGYVGYRWTFKEAGQPVAWIEKDHNYWCGNGYSITQNALGFYHKQWQQFPFCMNITGDLHGWDGPHASWAHGGIWASQGLWTPWGTCGTYQSGHAVVRIAANGHYDFYNDY